MLCLKPAATLGSINEKAPIFVEKVKEYLLAREIEVKDKGTYSEERVDFPLYAEKVAEAVAGKEADLGILCCGTGIGMSIAANKIKF